MTAGDECEQIDERADDRHQGFYRRRNGERPSFCGQSGQRLWSEFAENNDQDRGYRGSGRYGCPGVAAYLDGKGGAD